jgi:hypothetical protein
MKNSKISKVPLQNRINSHFNNCKTASSLFNPQKDVLSLSDLKPKPTSLKMKALKSAVLNLAPEEQILKKRIKTNSERNSEFEIPQMKRQKIHHDPSNASK